MKAAGLRALVGPLKHLKEALWVASQSDNSVPCESRERCPMFFRREIRSGSDFIQMFFCLFYVNGGEFYIFFVLKPI